MSSPPRQCCKIGIILIVLTVPDIEPNWHVRCVNRFAYYEICNKHVHKEGTVMNSGEAMMSNACQVGHRLRKPEASNGAMSMPRYISKSALLLTLSLVICCGAYTLSRWVTARGIFPLQANSSMLNGPDSKVVGSRQSAQPFAKDEYSQPRLSTASDDVSASTSSAVAASNNIFDQNRDSGAAKDPSLRRPTQRVCSFYDC